MIAWGTLAEHAAETLAKGTRVIVHGRLTERAYRTKDGEKRTTWELTADEIGPCLRHGNSRGGASASWEEDTHEPAPSPVQKAGVRNNRFAYTGRH